MMSRDFFGGLHRVRGYDYWWGYTMAQIELMAVDVPMVVYGKDKKFSTPSKEALEESAKRWQDKYGNGDGDCSVDVGDLLKGRVQIKL